MIKVGLDPWSAVDLVLRLQLRLFDIDHMLGLTSQLAFLIEVTLMLAKIIFIHTY